MAMIRVPYNNAMRLGQGVNSFTQQLCLLDAVNKRSRKKEIDQDEEADDDAEQAESIEDPDPSLGISQIVSYSSRFVDKVSDVMHDMNVSAALAIKMGSFEGAGSGKYINTDKFKESDLNFFIQVKVTNQEHMGTDYTEFNAIPLDPTRFTEVYGDAFISGWEEGGEFNALLSIRIKDKSNLTHISGELEASLAKGAITGKAEGSLDETLNNSDTETTVTVNWSGGGQLKDVNAPWDVNTMLQVACNFPELVAMTPQRKYAILTKYSMLPSFYASQTNHFAALDYENAGLYASYLLEIYTEYKSIWKELQVNCEDLQAGVPDMELARADTNTAMQDRIKLAADAANEVINKRDSTGPKFKPSIPKYELYEATVLGLVDARHDCRLEMLKIVHEVDLVRQYPEISLDPLREVPFVHPAVFQSLIPIRSTNVKSVKFYDGDPNVAPIRLRSVIQLYQSQAADYHMSAPWGRLGEPDSQNDTITRLDLRESKPLETLGTVYALQVYTDKTKGIITAYNAFYTNGFVSRSEPQKSDGSQILQWAPEQDPVQFVSIEGGIHGSRTLVDRIFLATTKDGHDCTVPPKDEENRIITARYARSPQWNLSGFWDIRPKDGVGISQLGVIWSRVDLSASKQLDLPSLFDGDAASFVNPQLLASLRLQLYSKLSRRFRLSACAGDTTQQGTQWFATNIFDFHFRSLFPCKVTALAQKVSVPAVQVVSTQLSSMRSGPIQAITIRYENWSARTRCTVPTNHADVDDNSDLEQFKGSSRGIHTVVIGFEKTTSARIRYIKFMEEDKDTLIPTDGNTEDAKERTIQRPADVEGKTWWFSGFYGAADGGGLLSLGVVWALQS